MPNSKAEAPGNEPESDVDPLLSVLRELPDTPSAWIGRSMDACSGLVLGVVLGADEDSTAYNQARRLLGHIALGIAPLAAELGQRGARLGFIDSVHAQLERWIADGSHFLDAALSDAATKEVALLAGDQAHVARRNLIGDPHYPTTLELARWQEAARRIVRRLDALGWVASQQPDAECISWFRGVFLQQAYQALDERCEALKHPPGSRERSEILATAPSPVPLLMARLLSDPALGPLHTLLNTRLDELQAAFQAFDDWAPGAPQVLPRHDALRGETHWNHRSPQLQNVIAVLRRFHDLASAEERKYFDRRYQSAVRPDATPEDHKAAEEREGLEYNRARRAWLSERRLGAAPADESADPDVLKKLRAAIALKGRNAKPDDVISTAELAEKVGRDGLRELELLGEYVGFAKPRPARYQK